MRILLACEYSAVCREAFKRKGWEAWSCGKIKKRYFTDCIIDNKLRTQESKSIFSKAVADAMVEQWTNFYLQKK